MMCPECRRGATLPRPSTSSPSPMLLTDFNHLHPRSQNSLVYTASHKMTGAATFAHRTEKKEKTKKKRKTRLRKNETSSRLFLLVFLSRYLASRTCPDCLTERVSCPLSLDQPATRRLLLGVK